MQTKLQNRLVSLIPLKKNYVGKLHNPSMPLFK